MSNKLQSIKGKFHGSSYRQLIRRSSTNLVKFSRYPEHSEWIIENGKFEKWFLRHFK